jgi:hypothetical protein
VAPKPPCPCSAALAGCPVTPPPVAPAVAAAVRAVATSGV